MSASATAVYAAIDHDRAFDKEGPADASEEPVVASEQLVLPSEEASGAASQPAVVTYVQPNYSYAAPLTYIYKASPLLAPAAEHPVITLAAGMRVVYTSRSNSQRYPATVLQRLPTGYLLQLDVDGGLKEVEDVEIWRVEYELADAEKAAEETAACEEKGSTTKPVKEKKAKKISSSPKGNKTCC
eukprot:TRINITY_DN93671_c0_g1_i1.p1 TRINITY_DN93671_c0_g1~~TRINITY_DN93671_c0_g1_i1.p1  ORF type:complete len:185 (+),score=55.90 TRINITY_DN93671_c0_g1_i1:78-632(+)